MARGILVRYVYTFDVYHYKLLNTRSSQLHTSCIHDFHPYNPQRDPGILSYHALPLAEPVIPRKKGPKGTRRKSKSTTWWEPSAISRTTQAYWSILLCLCSVEPSKRTTLNFAVFPINCIAFRKYENSFL